MAMRGRIWTVPNQITLLRLGFLPFFLILISYEHYRWALLVLILAALSDACDGLIARKFNQRSSLGAFLDPIADKLLLSSSFIILAMEKKLAWWLTILVLSRDVLILIVAVVIILISGYRPFPPSFLGKLTTVCEMLLVFTIVLADHLRHDDRLALSEPAHGFPESRPRHYRDGSGPCFRLSLHLCHHSPPQLLASDTLE